MTMGAIDIEIERLARTPGPPGLAKVEALVLVRMASEGSPRSRETLGLSGLAAAFGLVLGVVGGAVPPSVHKLDTTLSPLTDASLFPATTLFGVR